MKVGRSLDTIVISPLTGGGAYAPGGAAALSGSDRDPVLPVNKWTAVSPLRMPRLSLPVPSERGETGRRLMRRDIESTAIVQNLKTLALRLIRLSPQPARA